MSSTNGAEISADCQNGNDSVAPASSHENVASKNDEDKSVPEMSIKQLQAITFLSKTETALENCLKEEQLSDCKELQNVIKNLAIVLKNGERETKQCVVETLNKDDIKVLSLLQKVAFDLFKASVMQGISLSPQHPLILAYYCIGLIDPTEKLVKLGIIHPIVHHLKVMELFMTLTEEDLTLAKLLMSILCSCCDLESALTVMVQSGAHHALVYYIHMFEFNTRLQAKSALAVIVNKVEPHFQQFVKLTDTELSNVQTALTTCIRTKNLHVKLTDRQGSSDYHITCVLEMLRHLTANPDNMLSFGSSTFLGLYHSMLLEPDLSDAAEEILLLVNILCDHPATRKAVREQNGQLLTTLETLTTNENLQSRAVEVIWKILNEDTVTDHEIKPTADTNDIKEDKIASVLKVLLGAVKIFFLKNTSASQITKMEFYEVKTLFGEIFCFLRYLMALSEHFTITVIEKCSSEILSLLQVICDYSTWMICREKFLDKCEWSLMHPLFLFHFLFYFLINICDNGKKLLRDSGVLNMIVKELWMIQFIPKWHKGISKLAEIILVILLKCFEFIPQGLLCAGLLEQFCIEEEFLFRITSKPLLAAFSGQYAFNFKLVELLESEALIMVNLLQKSSNNPKKLIPVMSNIKDCIVLHLSFPEVEFIISNFLKGNPANQKVFYNSCVHEVVNVLDNVHPSVQLRVEDLIALIMGEVSSGLLVDSSKTGLEEEYSQVLYWMCCVSNSMRSILSDKTDDNLAEEYVPYEKDTLFVVGQKDLLFNDLFQLTDASTTEQGIKAFHLFLSQMPQFSILLKSLLKLSFNRILENDSSVNVPASSIFRLERIFSLLQDHCQKSLEFCAIIAHRGIISGLIDALFVVYACQSYRSIDFEWMLLHLAEPILYILAVCADNKGLHGYLWHLPKLLELYCNVSFQRCGALSKIIFSILSKSAPILSSDFELSDPEANFVYEMFSTTIYKQENELCEWIAYTGNSNDSLYYFISFCLHLVTNSSNAIKLLKCGILDCISFMFQRFKQESLLKIALQLLAKLSMFSKTSTEIKEVHGSMISVIEELLQKDSMKVDVFYCLFSLRIDVPKISDLPDGYTDAVAMFRTGEYHNCISKLQEMTQDTKQSPFQIQIIQTIGESYYKLYTSKLSSEHGNQSKHHGKIGADGKYYNNAKQAIRCLGDAYDHQLFGNEDTNSMRLDLAMMDCIFNVRDKPLSRCLLCRRKCGKGEKLIRSHIWPEALLRHLTGSLCGDSKQVFDASWKGTGNLQGPGQIYFTMLCKACENLFSKYEKAFKSLCFEKLYCEASKDAKQRTFAADEIHMSTVKAPGIPNSWLYLFCLSIAFRMFLVASQGCPANIGNFKSWYACFTAWREILLKEGSIQNKCAPKVALFIAPVNVLEEMSPPMAKVLFSAGAGAFCVYRLHDGVSISGNTAEFLLSSIGAVNIVVSYDETCFNFVPSECIVTLDSTKFVIPSAIRRYLLFPKGIWKEYKKIAAIVTERLLNMPQNKVNAPFNKTWISEEMKLFSGVLGESFDASDVCMNFLPKPFNRVQSVQSTTATLRCCKMFKIVLHMEEDETDACDNWFNFFMIRNENQSAFPELFAIIIFQIKSYLISVAYKISPADLSIEDAIQATTKAIFPQVESYFKIKMLVQCHLKKAITKAGFSDMALFVNWLKDFKSSCYCDLRCFPYCFACIDVCSCCMQTISVADAIPVYNDARLQEKNAIACGTQCLSYLTSTSSLPVILYRPKENATVKQLALQVCTNGVLFGFTGSKGKFIIYYFTSESSDRITVWCQYRLWCTQYIYVMLFDGSFNVIADHPVSAGFAELFTSSDSRKNFTQFVKDAWQFYQSLLAKPITDDMKYQLNDHSTSTSQADDGFEYFATMPTDLLCFHVPQAQFDEIDQKDQGDNCVK